MKVQYNNIFPTPYATSCIDDKIVFEAPNMIGQEVDWYMNETHCGNASHLPACSSNNAALLIQTNSNLLSYVVQGGFEYKIFYRVYPFSAITCTTQYPSGDIIIRIPYKLEILLGTKTPSGTTLEMDVTAFAQKGGINGRYPNYHNFQWYRNDLAISGANNTSYLVTLPGIYYLKAYSDCGLRTSSSITFDCNNLPWTLPTTYTNKTFTANATVTGNFYVIGTVTIDPGVTVNIQNGNMILAACSDIIIKKGTTIPNKSGGVLNLLNMKLASCGAWKGITVQGEIASNNAANKHGKLIVDGSMISDAEIGAYAYNGGILDVKNSSIFENNTMHLALMNYTVDKQLATIANTKFTYLKNTSNNCNFSLPTIQNSSVSKNVYIDNCYGAIFTSCDFNELDRQNTFTTNAIEGLTVNSPNINIYGLDVMNTTFNGSYERGIKLTGFTKVRIGTSDFKSLAGGILQNGIYAKNGSALEILNTNIGVQASNTNLYVSGLYCEQTENALLRLNTVKHCYNGVEYYQPSSVSLPSYLTRNIFENCDCGTLISPQCSPIGNVSCNTSTNQIKLRMRCNEFYTYDGIVGSGNLMDQEYSTGNGDDWGNIFSTSRFDIAWQNSNANGYTLPKIFYYTAALQPNKNLPLNSSITLNNTAINNGNYASNYDAQPKPNIVVNCGSLRPVFSNFYTQKDSIIYNNYSIFPNPATNHIIIAGNNENLVMVYIYDMTGKMIREVNLLDITKGKLMQIGNIPKGIYSIILRGREGELLYKEKNVFIEE
ncbi:MAG: T9SS type A sorting domain-containing protein [Bacteroidota bacterium]|nr:T9SS type A sorting domain-containing protein [Bacteroidota bacterium]